MFDAIFKFCFVALFGTFFVYVTIFTIYRGLSYLLPHWLVGMLAYLLIIADAAISDDAPQIFNLCLWITWLTTGVCLLFWSYLFWWFILICIGVTIILTWWQDSISTAS